MVINSIVEGAIYGVLVGAVLGLITVVAYIKFDNKKKGK